MLLFGYSSIPIYNEYIILSYEFVKTTFMVRKLIVEYN